MSLPGYIEARLSDHKPVCVEMRRTDKRAHAALPDSGGQRFAPAGSLLHDAGNMQGTSPAGGDDRPGVVAIMNAALYHVGGFQEQVDKTLKEWNHRHDFTEGHTGRESELGLEEFRAQSDGWQCGDAV